MNLLNFESVLLDMDGTLLDGHFDDLFWNDWVAKAYAAKNGLPLRPCQNNRFKATCTPSPVTSPGTTLIDWADHFGLDLESLQESGRSLIRVDRGPLLYWII